jgi:hypothetical protein
MGTQRVQLKGGLSLVGSLGSSCRYKRFCPALAALVDPVSSPCTISFNLSPSLSKLGQAVVQGRLSLHLFLWGKYAFRPAGNTGTCKYIRVG